jgi:acylphosphatase
MKKVLREKYMEKIGYKVIVSGMVQGVGFRYFTAKQANELAIYGHAKNLINGSVEVLIFGERAQLQTLLKWLEKGPKTSSVDDIKVTEIAYVYTNKFLCI